MFCFKCENKKFDGARRLNAMKKFFILLTMLLTGILLTTACGTINEIFETMDDMVDQTPVIESPGNVFVFDRLEITIGTNYSIYASQQQFLEDDFVRIPITVKNIANESHGL
jgi:hypothetical protein